MSFKHYMGGICLAAMFGLGPVQADHMSPWGQGHANMPNDIHNTRLDSDNEAFRDFVRYGEGADTVNRCLEIECPQEAEIMALAVEDQGLAVLELVARLNPLPSYKGRGQARYKVLEEEQSFSRILRINVRLRLVTSSGNAANQNLGLTADNAAGATVTAYLSHPLADDGYARFAVCSLPFEAVEYGDDEIADYATYALALKEDPDGLVPIQGTCTDPAFTNLLPTIDPGDLVDIGVLMPETGIEQVPVLMGAF